MNPFDLNPVTVDNDVVLELESEVLGSVTRCLTKISHKVVSSMVMGQMSSQQELVWLLARYEVTGSTVGRDEGDAGTFPQSRSAAERGHEGYIAWPGGTAR